MTKEVKVQSFSNINHDPINKFVRFYSGKEFTYSTFNGKIRNLLVRIGPGAFLPSADDVISLIDRSAKFPEDKVVKLYTKVV